MTWKITGAPGTGDDLLYSQAGTPTLDLRFASSKTLNDNVSGQNLIDFTRGGNGIGTYVGSDGLIKNSVVNLLLQSEDFSTTWLRENILAFGSGSTVNATIAPDGTVTADLITEDTTASALHRISQNLTASAGDATFSVYVKRANGARNLEINASVLLGGRAVFNLSNGTPGEVTSGTASIQNVGNGWYRCSVTGTSAGATTSAYLQLCTGTASSTRTYTGDGTSGIYLWGAQLEQSSTVGEYVKTTSSISGAPRFDHDPETGESLGLLVEEQRTNLLPNSQQIGLAGIWGINNSASGVLTLNNATAPDGTFTATTVVPSGVFYGPNDFVSVSASTDHTFSVWLKNNSATVPVRANIFGYYSQFLNGVLTPTNANIIASSIEEFPDGWYRISLTANSGAGGSLAVAIYGDPGEGFECWGAQIEAGAFPTSYIPTTTAAVTRSADVASITGANFSSWYRQDEGTVFADATNLAVVPASDFQTIAAVSDGTNNNRIELGFLTATLGNLLVRESGASSVSLIPVVSTLRRVAAGAYSSSSAAVSYNGAVPSQGDTVVLPTVNKLDIGGLNSTAIKELNGTISRLTYFDRRLPNATLQAITG
jgi:hypothetical protein